MASSLLRVISRRKPASHVRPLYLRKPKSQPLTDWSELGQKLAVVKWKKLFGFYADSEGGHFGTYTIDGNLTSDET